MSLAIVIALVALCVYAAPEAIRRCNTAARTRHLPRWHEQIQHEQPRHVTNIRRKS